MAVLTVTKDSFEQDVMKNEKPVFLDFWATWCGPCQMRGPIVDKAAEMFADRAVFGKVNVDEQPDLAQQFGVMSIPTLIVLKGGQIVEKRIGLQQLEEIEKMLP